MNEQAEPMATSESMLGLPWNSALKPLIKKFRPQYSTGIASSSCKTAKFMGCVCMENKSGSGRLGRPKGSICPMDTYSSSAEKMAETISSYFFRRSSSSSGSSPVWTGAASCFS